MLRGKRCDEDVDITCPTLHWLANATTMIPANLVKLNHQQRGVDERRNVFRRNALETRKDPKVLRRRQLAPQNV